MKKYVSTVYIVTSALHTERSKDRYNKFIWIEVDALKRLCQVNKSSVLYRLDILIIIRWWDPFINIKNKYK